MSIKPSSKMGGVKSLLITNGIKINRVYSDTYKTSNDHVCTVKVCTLSKYSKASAFNLLQKNGYECKRARDISNARQYNGVRVVFRTIQTTQIS